MKWSIMWFKKGRTFPLSGKALCFSCYFRVEFFFNNIQGQATEKYRVIARPPSSCPAGSADSVE